jgi:integrase
MAEQILPTFTKYVAALTHPKTGKPLAWETKKKIIGSAKRLLRWAVDTYPKKFKSLTKRWLDTLRPPRKPHNSKEHEYVKLDEVQRMVQFSTGRKSLALWRDQAAAAMLFLSGMRATAFTTLPIEAVDISSRTIKQWSELGVRTKNGKRATTYLLPIPELLDLVEQWDSYVRKEMPPEAMWYTPIESQWGEQSLSKKPPGKNRSQALAKRLRILFKETGIPYKSPHKFRHGNAVYGLQRSKTMADYKAVSMNLMHEDIKTTDKIYAPLLSDEVGQRIAGLSDQPTSFNDSEVNTVLNNLSNDQLAQLLAIASQRLSG